MTEILRILRHFQPAVDTISTGLFELTAEFEYITIYPRHRESYGIRCGTCGKTRCSIHREFSGHTAQPPKGNRGVSLFQEKILFSETGKVIPLGLRKFLCFEVDSSGWVACRIRASI